MDLFEKCYNFTRADEIKNMNLYPYFHPIEENEGPVVRVDGKRMIMAGSNNYLGLTSHPKVKEAAINSIYKYGTGCSGSRYLTGTLDLHIELEEKLAKFLGFESVLLFSTGYQTSLGAIAPLAGKGEAVVSDKENHACIVNGCLLAKANNGEFVRFKHNDMNDLERVLKHLAAKNVPGLIVTDGVFSVTGEIVNLPDMLYVAKKYNAKVLIDDAHALGVIGRGGRGTAEYFDKVKETDLVMSTFSKTLASLGGFVAGPERVINYLKHFSPAVIFSASPTPPSCAAAIAALEVLDENPDLVDKVIKNTDRMRKGFKELGFEIYESKTAIIPVIVGDVDKTFYFWRKLFDNGIFVNVFVPPGVPPNMSMIRTSYMATHEDEHLDEILHIFKKIGTELGLI